MYIGNFAPLRRAYGSFQKIMTGAALIAVALPFGVALLAGPVLLFTELLNRSVDKGRAANKLQ